MASFRAQYGIRLATDLPTMKWREFAAYMAGLDGKSPLGRIISIRAEEDPEILRQFTPDQNRIRNAWRTKKAKKVSSGDLNEFLDTMKRTFLGMAGISNARSEEAEVQENGGET